MKMLLENYHTQDDVDQFFEGQLVKANYFSQIMVYRIRKIVRDKTPLSLFTPRTAQSDKPAEQISYLQYYRQKYRINILEEDCAQPMILVQPYKISKFQEEILIPGQFLHVIVKNSSFKHFPLIAAKYAHSFHNSVKASSEQSKYRDLISNNLDVSHELHGWKVELDLKQNASYYQQYLNAGQLATNFEEISLRQLLFPLNQLNFEAEYQKMFKNYDGSVKFNPFQIKNWQIFV